MKKILMFGLALTVCATTFAASKKLRKIGYGEYVQLKSCPEFVEDGAWRLSATEQFNGLTKTDVKTTNDVGQIYTAYSYSGLSQIKLDREVLDDVNSSFITTNLEFISRPITTGLFVTFIGNTDVPKNEYALATANMAGTTTIVAKDPSTGVKDSKVVKFIDRSSGTVPYYSGDTFDTVNSIYSEWYSMTSNRVSRSFTLDCGATIYGTDRIRTTVEKIINPNHYVPLSCLSFVIMKDNQQIAYAFGNSISVGLLSKTDLPDDQVIMNINETHEYYSDYVRGVISQITAIKAINVYRYALNKGTYSQAELESVKGLVVYCYEQSIGGDCLISIPMAYNGSMTAENTVKIPRVPGFIITEHETVSPVYLNGFIGLNTIITWDDGSDDRYRHDGHFPNVINRSHYGEDFGQPVIVISNNKPVLMSIRERNGKGKNLSLTHRIMLDIGLEHGGGHPTQMFNLMTNTQNNYI